MKQSSGFYKDKYDVIVIGGALAGLSSALMLADKGKDVLVLERHNLPGGVATSFVRGGLEMEATLHEMMSIGKKENRLKVGKFLDDMGVNIDWLEVPEAYHASLPGGVEVTLHPGFETFAKEIDQAVPGTYDKVLSVLNLCHTVFDSVNELSIHPMSKVKMLLKHEAFVKTAGYSTKEVLDTFDLPQKALDLLAPYWIYVGSGFSELPFTIYAVLMADYVGYGSFVAKKFSHEMGVKMAERATEMGVQIEYRQNVEKILVKDGKAYGVRTQRGDEIYADYVISAAYPNKVYTQMVEPISEVPQRAIKVVNGRRVSLTAFSVVLTLDKSPEELNIKDYSVFRAIKTMDTDELFKELGGLGPYTYVTAICLNLANPDCTPKGQTSLSITTLPRPEAWMKVKAEDYDELKHRLAKQFIDDMSEYLGVNLLDHILEIVIETPMTVARYTGAWNGSIYGYAHTMEDHIVARLQTAHEESLIKHLEFAGAHQISGDGMAPQITNGRKAAKNVLDSMAEEAQK
ncbi:MAG: NAD(P)/FAD-dependent oxidoreductase [Sphaerochaetaceae bacterium]|nr:NAD(P)/FAD-dependent oxidoreductase [Sphaerochaetaceae bacterium]